MDLLVTTLLEDTFFYLRNKTDSNFMTVGPSLNSEFVFYECSQIDLKWIDFSYTLVHIFPKLIRHTDPDTFSI